MKTRNAVLALVLLASARGGTARAHEYWLAPTAYATHPGRPVGFGALAGTGFRGERKPWSPDHCVRFVARVARTLDLTAATRPGDLEWARFAPVDEDGALVAFESTFTPIQLPAAQFDAYLADQGLDAPLAARRLPALRPPGRERYRRCAKAWLAGRDTSRAMQPVGMPLEIVPLASPGGSRSLRIRVLWGGKPLAGALVKAWRSAPAAGGALRDPEARDSVAVAWKQRTDARGEATLPTDAPGEWLVSVVHMTPSAAREEADWESTWASLTFAIPAREERP